MLIMGYNVDDVIQLKSNFLFPANNVRRAVYAIIGDRHNMKYF